MSERTNQVPEYAHTLITESTHKYGPWARRTRLIIGRGAKFRLLSGSLWHCFLRITGWARARTRKITLQGNVPVNLSSKCKAVWQDLMTFLSKSNDMNSTFVRSGRNYPLPPANPTFSYSHRKLLYFCNLGAMRCSFPLHGEQWGS